MRGLLALVLAVVAACGSDGDGTVDAPPFVFPPDATVRIAPNLTSFTASPAAAPSGVPTEITWSWTYATPPFPEPTCSISNGVGAVSNGDTTTLTQATITTYTLTCTNAGGMSSRPVVVTTGSPIAPTISSFTATPNAIVANTPTNVTWNWTYSSTPNPPAGCSINNGVGAVTQGQTTSVMIASPTVFTLTCMNAAGQGTRTTTISIAVAPVIATFSANPSSVTANTPTSVQWSWTYTTTPNPTPSCSIDNGVGAVTNFATRTITIPDDTVFTLTCTSTAGTDTEVRTIVVP